MPSDLRKISGLAVVLLVVLRISMGWHLFYEGLWKLTTQNTPTPWTAEGYLKNSTGPMRNAFRKMTGDANDLKWLDYEAMSAKWDAWRDRFVAHYGIEQKQIDRLLDGPGGFSAALEELPPEFDFEALVKSAGVAKDAIQYDAGGKRLTIDGKLHLLPNEQARLLDAVDDEKKKKGDSPESYDKLSDAIRDAATRASKLSFRERLAAMLKGDPERVGIPMKAKKEGDAEQFVVVGEVKHYLDMIERYEANYAKAKTKYQWEHLERQWSELQTKRRSLVGPVQSLEKELFDQANKLLSLEQLGLGPVPPAVTEMSQINFRTMWTLTILGVLLMLGLFTRLSAFMGAGLLTLFYMAMPPWPGVQELPSVEHNLIVNKVLVEVLALLAISALPSGKWFGVDAIISLLFRGRARTEMTVKPATPVARVAEKPPVQPAPAPASTVAKAGRTDKK